MITQMIEKLESVYPKAPCINIEIGFNKCPGKEMFCDYTLLIRGEALETFDSLSEMRAWVNSKTYKVSDSVEETEKQVETACPGDSPPSV